MAAGRQYNHNGLTVNATGDAVSFGFAATNLRLIVDGASPVYLNLTSTSGAATTDFKIAAGTSVHFSGRPLEGLSGISACTTAAATSTLRILATLP